MTWSISGTSFRDRYGRHAFLHGINFVDKNPENRPTGVQPWSEEDLAQAASWGLNAVRLDVMWAHVMPEPGQPNAAYLDWLAEQVDACYRQGLHIVLDAHQDLYAQAHSDGAPAWATLGLLFFATTWWHVLLCYLVLMFGRYVISTAAVAVDALWRRRWCPSPSAW